MRAVQIAADRLQTSRLGFGTSTLHHLRSSRARARLLGCGFSLGIRYFDTAPLYGHGLAERELGLFMRGRRDELVVATKFGIAANRWLAHSTPLLYAGLGLQRIAGRAGFGSRRPRPRDYSAARAQASLEASLRNLRTDHVDLFFMHDPLDPVGEFNDESARALERIRSNGKARFIGISGTAESCLRIAQRYPHIADVLQVDVGAGSTLRLLRAGMRPDVTFGHFRPAVSAAAGASVNLLPECGPRAAAMNPQGVILFSTRSEQRLESMVNALGCAPLAAAA